MSLERTINELRDVGALMREVELRHLFELALCVPHHQEIVEVGSWAGGSAAWMCAGARAGAGAHITCVDIWEDWVDPPLEDGELIIEIDDRRIRTPHLGADALARFGEVVDWSRVVALRAPSLTVAPMWVKPIGMLFIDACHRYQDCRDDLVAWTPHVVPDGIVAVHDYNRDPPPEHWWAEGPTRAVDELVDAGSLRQTDLVGALWVGCRSS